MGQTLPAEAPFPSISERIRLQKLTDVKRFLSLDGYAEPESRIRKNIIRFRPVHDQQSSGLVVHLTTQVRELRLYDHPIKWN